MPRLLAFSRKQELTFEAVDVSELVRGMANLLQRSIGPLIEINTSFPLKLPKARSDPNQLENALLNLVVNARDAMPDGGVITISARRRTLSEGQISDLPSGDYICLSVKDEGEGMDAETLEKATQPFFTTKGVGKGTGLGLPMIQGLMAQSGGRLSLNSTVGRGTMAELWLPLAHGGDLDELEPEPVVEVAAPEPFKPLTVLAVDDDSLVLMNTVLMLEDLGHTTMEAQSAVEALQVLDLGPLPDVVITDHAMPHTTGSELAALIIERYPGIAVILATGYAELPSGEESALPRLAKPFGQAQLQRALALAAATD